MPFKAPKAIVETACTAGITKSELPFSKELVLGFLAGAFIAFGGLLGIVVGKGSPELNAANPGLESLVTDVAVPISELPTAVTTALAECAAAGFEANLVGHVGDGNFHLNLYLPEDPAARAAAKGVVDRLTERALAVGGTATGEHGVGLRKLGYMEREHGASLGLMRAIKQLLDPAGIMNPGKKLPEAP